VANYYGQTRTNYFLVKDAEAFKAEMANYPVNVIEQKIGEETGYGILDEDSDGGGLPWSLFNEDTDDYDDLVWEDIIGKHLKDGEVCVLMETGAEKYRYLSGWAIAFNNKGETRRVDITDIYDLAKEIGTGITQAEY
jgi:hypothetical protein